MINDGDSISSEKFPIFGMPENFLFRKLWLFATTKGLILMACQPVKGFLMLEIKELHLLYFHIYIFCVTIFKSFFLLHSVLSNINNFQTVLFDP